MSDIYKQVRKFLMLAVALALVIVGMVTSLLPIPFGVVPLLIGAAMVMMVSPPVRRKFHELRDRYPSFDRRLSSIEPHLPVSLQKILRPDNVG